MASSFSEIVEVLQIYLDGLYYSDTARLRRVFHHHARYVCAVEDPLINLSMEEYFPIVDKRPSPASKGEVRADEIVSIEQAGPVTAFVRLECAIPPKQFIDLLTLIRVDGRWQIISKVFHYEFAESAI